MTIIWVNAEKLIGANSKITTGTAAIRYAQRHQCYVYGAKSN